MKTKRRHFGNQLPSSGKTPAARTWNGQLHSPVRIRNGQLRSLAIGERENNAPFFRFKLHKDSRQRRDSNVIN